MRRRIDDVIEGFRRAVEISDRGGAGAVTVGINVARVVAVELIKFQGTVEKLNEQTKLADATLEETINAMRISEAENRRLREALTEYGVHHRDCIAGQRREGKPTDDGYMTLYGYGQNERWYPKGKTPECDCGLSAALGEEP